MTAALPAHRTGQGASLGGPSRQNIPEAQICHQRPEQVTEVGRRTSQTNVLSRPTPACSCAASSCSSIDAANSSKVENQCKRQMLTTCLLYHPRGSTSFFTAVMALLKCLRHNRIHLNICTSIGQLSSCWQTYQVTVPYLCTLCLCVSVSLPWPLGWQLSPQRAPASRRQDEKSVARNA